MLTFAMPGLLHIFVTRLALHTKTAVLYAKKQKPDT